MSEKKRILIIEDDNVLRDVLAEKLEKSGYVVDRAEDGVIAMDKVRSSKVDLILLDIIMPRKGGMEVLEELHADSALKNIPVIVISNSGQPVEIERAQQLGARDFLVKAVFDPNEVLSKVSRILAGEIIPSSEWGGKMKNDTTTKTEETKSAPQASASTIAVKNKNGEKVFVLVVEDDKFLRELLVRKLGGDGFEVENAIDSVAAFAIIAKRKPNIVLLDIILPGIDGFEILTRVKADPNLKDIPVVMLSNLGQKEDVDRAIGLGAEDFMVKANFTLDEIVAKIRSIVG
ncbi:MAG: response regulator [Candidatus Pacebacteria bacterium]|nr:response regulator [Candidatus Paceibacterota bacterium]